MTPQSGQQGVPTAKLFFRSSILFWSISTALLALLLLGSVPGCKAGPYSNANSANSGSIPDLALQEETLWSSTLHWAGARFRFELQTDGKNAKPQFDRSQLGDLLRVGDLEVELVRTRFRIAGVYYRWQPDSIIWIHRPPRQNRPFFRQEGTLQLTWVGSDEIPIVEEQLADGSYVWTMGQARVTRDKDGTVHYQGRSPDRSQSGPWKIYIDSAGRLIGALQ